MKLLFSIVLIFTSCIGHTQIDATYEVIQQRFGLENISITDVNESRIEIKSLNPSETIAFTYTSEGIVKKIDVESRDAIDSDRFHNLANQLVPGFKFTSSGTNVMEDFFYDSSKALLIVKSYRSLKKSQLAKITFISEPSVIVERIPDIADWN